MKTHQEIHNEIEEVKRGYYGSTDSPTIRILHALNDRIEALDQWYVERLELLEKKLIK